jgi:hypothetical protein
LRHPIRHPSAWAVLTSKDTGGEQQRDLTHGAQDSERAFVIVHAATGSGLAAAEGAASVAVEAAGGVGSTMTGAARGLGSDPPHATRRTATTADL